MKNRSPACERQSCWHKEGTGRPEAQKEHKVLNDMIQLFACRPCLLIQFDLSSSKLPLKIFLHSQAELHVSQLLPAVAWADGSPNYFYYVLKNRQNGSTVLIFIFGLYCLIQEKDMQLWKLFIVFKHKGRENNTMNPHTHFPLVTINILPTSFYLSPQICCFCFSWNILKQNQDKTSCHSTPKLFSTDFWLIRTLPIYLCLYNHYTIIKPLENCQVFITIKHVNISYFLDCLKVVSLQLVVLFSI